MIKVKDDEESDDFELVQTDEEQKKEKEEKEIRAEVTLIELIHMLKDAEMRTVSTDNIKELHLCLKT